MIFFLNQLKQIKHVLLVSIISLSILSCGTESIIVSGISGTGIVFGSITGFGSIFVNGVEYEIDEATFDVDGESGTGLIDNGNLKLGMVVRLDATDNGDGTGVATKVIYEDIIEGPVVTTPATPASGDTNLKQFEVMGLTVIINATTTSFDGGISFETLDINDVIEVSGFADQVGNILATRVEKTGDLVGGSNNTEVEIHGMISEIISPTEVKVNNIIVHTDNETILEDIDSLKVGIYVEVQGKYQDVNGSINADKIEGEDDDREEISSSTGSISLHGVVSRFVSISDFDVNGLTIDATAIASSITYLLVDGLEVEVDGDIVDGIVIARELEVRASDARFKAEITSLNESTIGIGYPNVEGEIILTFDSQSQLEDEQEQFVPMTFADLAIGMFIKVEVKSTDNGWLVLWLKRDDDTATEFEFELEGIVSEKSGVDSLTINGLTVVMSPQAEYEIGDEEDVSATDFFAAIEVGTTIIKLEDEDQDGVFDEAEIN